MARFVNYFELKQRILEERSQIPTERNVHNNAIRCGIRKALRCLEQCQSVTDMVELVRCKDCKKRFVPFECGLWQGMVNGNHLFLSKDDDFWCAYGERRTDEAL